MDHRCAAPVFGLALLAACSAETAFRTAPAPGHVEDAPRRVAAIDWSRAVPVTVRLSEYTFEPAFLVFKQGQPYRLHLDNTGKRAHTFTSDGFFKAIAARRLTTPDGVVEQPYLQVIEVPPGEAAEVDFVAVRPGIFPLDCDEPLHGVFGMTGKIRVE
ncbi:MAG TPA: multicopper oxidase domain-containing protein [Azospirillaceae bacterium]|nr:multicopper oxidase domain-containing protein [Azospirillaceae bacterium]